MEYHSLLMRVARRSKFERARHASLVLKGGAIISYAHNGNFTHSEVRALKKLWPNKREGTTVINLRFTAGNKIGCSKPCKACEGFLREAGVAKVVYTDKDGQFREMRL